MPNIDKLLKQNNAGFKRYTGIHKGTFYEMLNVMQQQRGLVYNLLWRLIKPKLQPTIPLCL